MPILLLLSLFALLLFALHVMKLFGEKKRQLSVSASFVCHHILGRNLYHNPTTDPNERHLISFTCWSSQNVLILQSNIAVLVLLMVSLVLCVVRSLPSKENTFFFIFFLNINDNLNCTSNEFYLFKYITTSLHPSVGLFIFFFLTISPYRLKSLHQRGNRLLCSSIIVHLFTLTTFTLLLWSANVYSHSATSAFLNNIDSIDSYEHEDEDNEQTGKWLSLLLFCWIYFDKQFYCLPFVSCCCHNNHNNLPETTVLIYVVCMYHYNRLYCIGLEKTIKRSFKLW